MDLFEKKLALGGIINQPGSTENYKTGDWRTQVPSWDRNKCIHCLLCVNYCPENCIFLKRDNNNNLKRDESNLDFCKGCGICVKICPVKALTMKSEKS